VVAVPSATVPWIVNQYVDVPLVASTCPGVPVALVLSLSSPVTCNLEIVVEARNERPEAVKLVVEALVNVAFVEKRLVLVLLAITPLVAFKLVEKRLVLVLLVITPLVAFKLVEKRLVEVALVVVELVTVRPVMLAKVATKLEKNPLVVVELVKFAF
jgi:hypothetical protein